MAVYLDGVNVMAKSGCFFLTELGIAQTEAQVTLTAEQILAVVLQTQSTGALKDNMIVEPGRGAEIITAGLSAAGVDLAAAAVGWTGYTGPRDAAAVRGTLTSGSPHWREANAEGVPIWDPYPGATFKEGRSREEYEYYQFVERSAKPTWLESFALDWAIRSLRADLGL